MGINICLNDRYYMRIFYPQGFDDYYILNDKITLEEITIRENEVLGIKYATKQEILEMMEKKEFVNYAEGFIELLFSFSKQRGSYIK